jgi:type I restriction enzyme S subunit
MTPLAKCGAFIRGLTYSAGDVADSGLLVLRSTNIQDGNLVLDRDLVFVGKPCPLELALQPGDLAICMSNGSKALVGKSAEYHGGYSGPLTVGAFCSIFRPQAAFAKLAFRSDRYTEFVSLAIGGGNINNLKNSDLEAFEFPVPTSPAEQQKIADCLTSLDEVIAAQGRKVEALKAHKKGLMQHLFPQEGQTLPRLRFPEFRDGPDWDTRTIGVFGDISMCKRIFASQTNDREGVPFYKIGTLGGKPDAYISREVYEHYRARYCFPKVGDVLITCAGTVGKCVVYDGEDAYYQDSNIVWIENSEAVVSNRFLHAVLINYDWSKLNSTTIARIYLDDLRNVRILVPLVKAEQQRIADCLSALDARLTAEAARLDALKTHKKGLMQGLFPAPTPGEPSR